MKKFRSAEKQCSLSAINLLKSVIETDLHSDFSDLDPNRILQENPPTITSTPNVPNSNVNLCPGSAAAQPFQAAQENNFNNNYIVDDYEQPNQSMPFFEAVNGNFARANSPFATRFPSEFEYPSNQGMYALFIYNSILFLFTKSTSKSF